MLVLVLGQAGGGLHALRGGFYRDREQMLGEQRESECRQASPGQHTQQLQGVPNCDSCRGSSRNRTGRSAALELKRFRNRGGGEQGALRSISPHARLGMDFSETRLEPLCGFGFLYRLGSRSRLCVGHVAGIRVEDTTHCMSAMLSALALD